MLRHWKKGKSIESDPIDLEGKSWWQFAAEFGVF